MAKAARRVKTHLRPSPRCSVVCSVWSRTSPESSSARTRPQTPSPDNCRLCLYVFSYYCGDNLYQLGHRARAQGHISKWHVDRTQIASRTHIAEIEHACENSGIAMRSILYAIYYGVKNCLSLRLPRHCVVSIVDCLFLCTHGASLIPPIVYYDEMHDVALSEFSRALYSTPDLYTDIGGVYFAFQMQYKP